jgi:excisionase family DNA binding protein
VKSKVESLTMRVEDAAKLLGIGRSAAYNAARAGSLPGAFRVGGRILVSKAALERAIDNPERRHE